MSKLSIWALPQEKVEIQVLESPPLPSEVRARVDQLWQKAQAQSPWLHDSHFFSLARPLEKPGAGELRLEGFFLPYRQWIACREEPNLRTAYACFPLAVSGLCELEGGYLWGQRGRQVTQDKEAWELVPSGGLSLEACAGNRLLPELQLKSELVEEIGIPGDEIKTCELKAVMTEAGVTDLVYHLRIGNDFAKVRERFQKLSVHEYSDLLWTHKTKSAEILSDPLKSVSAASRAVLNFFAP